MAEEENAEVNHLRHELAAKEHEIETLQSMFDNFTESSAAIEKELENDLAKAEDRNAMLQKENARLKEGNDDLHRKISATHVETERLARELTDLKSKLSDLGGQKKRLETDKDDLEQKVRALEASEETLRHKLETVLEEKILTQHDLEDLKEKAQETEARLNEQIADLQNDVMVLRMSVENASATPPPPPPPPLHDPIPPLPPSIDPAQHEALQAALAPQKTLLDELQQQLLRVQGERDQAILLAEEAVAEKELYSFKEEKEEGDDSGGLAHKVAELEEMLHSTQSKLEQARAEVLLVREEASEEATKAATTSKAKEKLEEMLESTRSELEQARAEVSMVREEATELVEKAATATAAAALKAKEDKRFEYQRNHELMALELADKVAELEEALRLIQAERDEALERAHMTEADLSSFEQQIHEDTTMIADQVAKIQVLEKENENLKKEAAAAELALSTSQKIRLNKSMSSSTSSSRANIPRVAPASLPTSPLTDSNGGSLLIDNEEHDLTATQRDLLVARVHALETALSESRRKSLDVSTLLSSTLTSTTSSSSKNGSTTTHYSAPTSSSMTRSKQQQQQQQQQQYGSSSSSPSFNEGHQHQDSSLEGLAKTIEKAVGSGNVDVLAEQLRMMAVKYHQQRAFNSRLLSRMQTMQNKIQVCCRIRPVHQHEASGGQSRLVIDSLSELEVGYHDRRAGHSGWKAFAFDRVWGPEQTQEDVFLDVEALALSVMEGNNVCIMAYGQTGSGKTYTMGGASFQAGVYEDHGISYRLLSKVMDLVSFRLTEEKQPTSDSGGKKEAGKDGQIKAEADVLAAREEEAGSKEKGGEGDGEAAPYKVSLSMVEVYNDEVRDLFVSPSFSTSSSLKEGVLDIRRDSDGMLQLPGMMEEGITSVHEAMQAIDKGNKNRATASTNIHDHSSRSHSILMVTITSTMTGKSGRLYLVDLAGSERIKKSAVTGAELKEAQHINKSLSALGDVMEALDRKASHIPYRNSKLTHLLQDCLGGSARTLMIVTVCPLEDTADETLCTLQFASRVRNIVLTGEASGAKLKNMEMEFKILKAENRSLNLKRIQAEEAMTSLKKEYQALQRKVNTVIESKKTSADDAKRNLDEQVTIMRASNQDLVNKLSTEKATREKAATELDDMHRQLKKMQLLLDSRHTALNDAKAVISARERELVELRKLQRLPMSGATTNSSNSSSVPGLTLSMRPTNTVRGASKHTVSKEIGGGDGKVEAGADGGGEVVVSAAMEDAGEGGGDEQQRHVTDEKDAVLATTTSSRAKTTRVAALNNTTSRIPTTSSSSSAIAKAAACRIGGSNSSSSSQIPRPTPSSSSSSGIPRPTTTTMMSSSLNLSSTQSSSSRRGLSPTFGGGGVGGLSSTSSGHVHARLNATTASTGSDTSHAPSVANKPTKAFQAAQAARAASGGASRIVPPSAGPRIQNNAGSSTARGGIAGEERGLNSKGSTKRWR